MWVKFETRVFKQLPSMLSVSTAFINKHSAVELNLPEGGSLDEREAVKS